MDTKVAAIKKIDEQRLRFEEMEQHARHREQSQKIILENYLEEMRKKSEQVDQRKKYTYVKSGREHMLRSNKKVLKKQKEKPKINEF